LFPFAIKLPSIAVLDRTETVALSINLQFRYSFANIKIKKTIKPFKKQKNRKGNGKN